MKRVARARRFCCDYVMYQLGKGARSECRSWAVMRHLRAVWLKNYKLPAWSPAALLALALGCGGPSYKRGIYDNGMVRLRVLEPMGWERVEISDNQLVFNHPKLGSISLLTTCKDYEDVPEQALMNQLLMGTRERNYRLEETITVDGRGALHDIVDLELDGVPVTLEVFLVKKDGCVYDISRVSSRSAFEPGRDALLSLVRGFHVVATRLDEG